ncbi:MAG TPA: DEAD/DEAH box helicase [Longimicrobiales bacterium]|nr:DEAD/DEAH box helicase [Longimicrobiales bacterium]
MAFATLKLHPTLLKGVDALGFTQPTPIQTEAIPHALDGRDLLACAATGSGKTAAFLLPILHDLVDRPRGTTRALVIAPTRELALQIVEDMQDLARFSGVTAAAVYGGVGMGPQEKAFRKGADVIVATPGRLLDHFQYDYARLAGLEFLVLDEADRMLDMGFLPDIRRVLKHVPKPKQVLFFSATMPPEIEKLTHEILDRPVKVALQRKAAPAAGVTQAAYPVPQKLKSALLLELLSGGSMDEALVFTRTKHRANRLAKFLHKHDIPAERIHGNRSQAQRTKALAGFKRGDFRVLVATDIAARGIDVEALGHVVNFDVPNVPEDYIHRVGRTARAEMTGEAYTLVSPEEEQDFGKIERAVGARIGRVRLQGFDYDRTGDALEVPRAERIRAIQEKRREDRARAAAKAERKQVNQEASGRNGGTGSPSGRNGGTGSSSGRRRRRGRKPRS